VTDRYREGYVLTSDPGRVDIDRVHAWLSQESYWDKGRERAVVERSIAGSRPYSVYSQEQQATFARVVTDEATFAWIFEVFVDEHHRGRGLGTWLLESIVEDLSVLNVGLVYVPATSFTVWKVCRSLPNSGIRPERLDLAPPAT